MLLTAAVLSFAWGLIAALSGGIDTRIAGVAIRARGAYRPVIAGLALLGAYAALDRDGFVRIADFIERVIARAAVPIAIAASVLVGAVSVRYGSFTAGGSDSYGYVSEAYGWTRGELPAPIPLPYMLQGPTADLMQIPLAYREGARPHTMVPTYAPGLPLLMAAGIALAGDCGPFVIVPVSAALLVWCTFALGRRGAGPTAGALSAVIVATAPVVLFQSMSPMSDVPAGAFWTAALAAALAGSRRWSFVAGLCTAAGVLIRPNVLPLAAVPAFASISGARGRERLVRIGAVLLPVILAQVFISVLYTRWYGSPLASGYGHAVELYAFGNIWPNLKLYSAWFLESESAWALVGLVALLPIAWKHADGWTIGICVMMVAATLAAYLAYSPFEVWWYLRFLLPAGGAAAALIGIGIVTLARAVPQPWGRLAAVVTFAALVAATTSFASRAGVFGDLGAGERHYVDVGEFVARALPRNAVVFAVQHSGTVRYYGGRMTLRFDQMEKDASSRVIGDLEQIGLHPYLVADDFELPQARSMFSVASDARLPFPVIARMRELGGTTVFDLASHPEVPTPVALEPATAHTCGVPGLPLRVR